MLNDGEVWADLLEDCKYLKFSLSLSSFSLYCYS